MRTAGEARYAHCAQSQGHLAYHMGNLKEAQETFEAAGEGAILRAEVYDAATSFVYAALTAASRSRFHDAQRLGQRAALLVESPLLRSEERMTLKRRLPDFIKGLSTSFSQTAGEEPAQGRGSLVRPPAGRALFRRSFSMGNQASTQSFAGLGREDRSASGLRGSASTGALCYSASELSTGGDPPALPS